MNLFRSMIFAFAALAFGTIQSTMAQTTVTYSNLKADDTGASKQNTTTILNGSVTSSNMADNSTITLLVTVGSQTTKVDVKFTNGVANIFKKEINVPPGNTGDTATVTITVDSSSPGYSNGTNPNNTTTFKYQ